MTQEYRIWEPEHDGHAPPNWREGMEWAVDLNPACTPMWHGGSSYAVPLEALNSPNDDAAAEQKIDRVEIVVGSKRQREVVSLNELARLIKGGAAIYGITLAPEKDWATELWADLMEAWRMRETAANIRDGRMEKPSKDAINLLRTRFEQMKGEG